MSVDLMNKSTNLPPYLVDEQRRIERWAREYGLDFFETVFEMLDYQRMNEVAAYGGFPVRYPHWRFGMEYERLAKGYTYGLSKIYEMVINNDPCYAYLLEGNSLVDQKMVMAHVYGHCDFFKNNYYFSKTNRKMIDGMANHAARTRRHVERQGIDKVESFIDVCLSLDNLIDPYSAYIVRRAPPQKKDESEEAAPEAVEVPRLKAKAYMDRFINPPEFLSQQKAKIEPIVHDAGGKVREIGARSFVEIAAIAKSAQVRISEELTPEQREQFAKLEKPVLAKVTEWAQKEITVRSHEIVSPDMKSGR